MDQIQYESILQGLKQNTKDQNQFFFIFAGTKTKKIFLQGLKPKCQIFAGTVFIFKPKTKV